MAHTTLTRYKKKVADLDPAHTARSNDPYAVEYVRRSAFAPVATGEIFSPGAKPKPKQLETAAALPKGWQTRHNEDPESVSYFHMQDQGSERESRLVYTEHSDRIVAASDFKPSDAYHLLSAAIVKWPSGALELSGPAQFQRTVALAAVLMGEGHRVTDRKLVESVTQEWEQSPVGRATKARAAREQANLTSPTQLDPADEISRQEAIHATGERMLAFFERKGLLEPQPELAHAAHAAHERARG